jgi:hypothetical protein
MQGGKPGAGIEVPQAMALVEKAGADMAARMERGFRDHYFKASDLRC